MSFWQALFMGLLQGATELFPVSSLGHAVLLPSLLHWSFKQSNPSFVPFLVLLHLGTASALLVLYRTQWVEIVIGFFRAAIRGRITTPTERLSMLLLVGTLPAGVLGVYLENRIKSLFASPYVAASFLIVNGLLMLGFEILRRRAERRTASLARSREEQEERFADAAQISFRAAALVGACQALAFVPGISRSGVTIGGGLLAGLRHQEAARFSFLLATPVILAAGLVRSRCCSRAACLWASTPWARCSQDSPRTPARAFCCATFGRAGLIPTAGTASPPGCSAWLC